MADHVMKKYIAKVEKTIWVVEELEIMAETEKEAEELLDDYCVDVQYGTGEEEGKVKLVETEEQEVSIEMSWIDSSEELSVDEFMEIDGGQTAYRD
tara:strand:+ start:394 stop:681 length:288 start_codon:yes stop_codon:yes gene_type:complete